MNSNLIKMPECINAKQDIWQFINILISEKAGKNPRMTYFFDIEKCKRCLYKAGCYKEGAKGKPTQKH